MSFTMAVGGTLLWNLRRPIVFLRIGQERKVIVHLPILSDPSGRLPSTLDERLHDLLERKRDLARDFLVPGEGEDALAKELYESL